MRSAAGHTAYRAAPFLQDLTWMNLRRPHRVPPGRGFRAAENESGRAANHCVPYARGLTLASAVAIIEMRGGAVW